MSVLLLIPRNGDARMRLAGNRRPRHRAYVMLARPGHTFCLVPPPSHSPLHPVCLPLPPPPCWERLGPLLALVPGWHGCWAWAPCPPPWSTSVSVRHSVPLCWTSLGVLATPAPSPTQVMFLHPGPQSLVGRVVICHLACPKGLCHSRKTISSSGLVDRVSGLTWLPPGGLLLLSLDLVALGTGIAPVVHSGDARAMCARVWVE